MSQGPLLTPASAAAPRSQTVVGTALYPTSLISSGTLLAVVLQVAAGVVLYLALFVVALGRHNRAVYTAKLKELTGPRRALASAV